MGRACSLEAVSTSHSGMALQALTAKALTVQALTGTDSASIHSLRQLRADNLMSPSPWPPPLDAMGLTLETLEACPCLAFKQHLLWAKLVGQDVRLSMRASA